MQQKAQAHLDGVSEGHGDRTKTDIGQQIAQRVHSRQGQDCHKLQYDTPLSCLQPLLSIWAPVPK